MKTRHIFLLLLLTLPACNKSTIDKQETLAEAVFNGSSRIRGSFVYTSLLKTTTDSAKNVSLVLYKGADTADYYALKLPGGSFDIGNLGIGTYYMKVAFSVTPYGTAEQVKYQSIIPVKITTDNSFQDNLSLPVALLSTPTPTLKINVRDGSGSAVTGALVALYTDEIILLKNINRGTGAVRTAITNSFGVALFPDLQNISYYPNAFIVSGQDTVSNTSQSVAALGPLKTGLPLSEPVTIASNNTSLQVTVHDASGANISGAKVCIYSDKNLVAQYGFHCTGSLRSSFTNNQGVAVFNNLQQLQYYISASEAIGKDTISNGTDAQKPTPKLSLKSLNNNTVTIK